VAIADRLVGWLVGGLVVTVAVAVVDAEHGVIGGAQEKRKTTKNIRQKKRAEGSREPMPNLSKPAV